MHNVLSRKRVLFAMTLVLGLSTLGVIRAKDDPYPDGERPTDNNYESLWYRSGKYQGGMGTAFTVMCPFAVYSKEAHKTFFVWGGPTKDERGMREMVSYYDHATGLVPRPRIVHFRDNIGGRHWGYYNREGAWPGEDPHDTPTISLDDEGYIWVFIAGRGDSRRGLIYRSMNPYDITSFHYVTSNDGKRFPYPQPWYVPGKGFVFFFSEYKNAIGGSTGELGHELFCQASGPVSNGKVSWNPVTYFAEYGHYQVSWMTQGKVYTAFSYFADNNLNNRTNLYYVQTDDAGKTFRSAAGKPITLPMRFSGTHYKNEALAVDYYNDGAWVPDAKKRLTYPADVNHDNDGNPVILYIESSNTKSRESHPPRYWMIAHWTGSAWKTSRITEADNNYDVGSIFVEPDGTWRIIAPTKPGPIQWHTGGEMIMWTSNDKGETWHKVKNLTPNSTTHHSYARRALYAHEEFYTVWCDGLPDTPSICRVYFAGKNGDVYRLPFGMKSDFEKPEKMTAATRGTGDVRETPEPLHARVRATSFGIAYTVPKANGIRIAVYDCTGKMMLQTKKVYRKAGSYTIKVDWHAGPIIVELHSGISRVRRILVRVTR